METNIETPRPEAPPYNWPSHDLKNLVMLAPMSPYTRALLRIKFNCPVPDGATTFEQIEAWLATLKPIHVPKPNVWTPTWQPNSEEEEIRRGDYIKVDAEEDGYNKYTRNWTKRDDVKVPLSVWEQGLDEVREYVQNAISELEEDEHYDYDFDETCYGGYTIHSNLRSLMATAEEMIRQRDGEDEDEDEE